MSNAKKNRIASSAKQRRSRRREPLAAQDRGAHFSSEWVITIDGELIARDNEPGKASRTRRSRRLKPV